MVCWKCGGHMTKYGGTATCDNCGRIVSYGKKNKSISNVYDPSSISYSSGSDDGCLTGCLTGCLKTILFVVATLLILGIVSVVALLVWIFF